MASDLSARAELALAAAVELHERLLGECKRRMRDLAELDITKLQQVSGVVTKVSRSLPPLVHQTRQLIRDLRKAAETLTLDEKRALVVGFARDLPQEQRAALMTELEALEHE